MTKEEPPANFITDHRHGYEKLVVGVLATAITLVVAGSILAAIGPILPLDDAAAQQWGMLTAGVGGALLALLVAAAHPVRTLETLWSERSGGRRYDRLKNWNRLKVSCVLLNLLTVIIGGVLGFALLSHFNIVEFDPTLPALLQVHRLITLFGAVTAASIGVAFYIALRTPLEEKPTTGVEVPNLLLAAVAATVLAVLAGVLGGRTIDVPLLGSFTPTDAPFLLLAALGAASVSLFISRSLPTFYWLFTEEREYYKSQTYASQTKSVVMPIVIAFAILFVVLFVLIAFQVSFVGVLDDVSGNAVLIAVLVVIALAMIVSVAASFMLSRSEDKTTLYKRKRSTESRKEIGILAVSAVTTTLLLLWTLAIYMGKAPLGIELATERWTDLLAITILSAVGPYGFYYAARSRRIKRLEERFPDFLRDLAASRRAGLTMEAAVQIAARGEYGALTPEIQKMADQLSWNISFIEALNQFNDRVRTPLIERAVSLINEASRTGGQVTDVLITAATDAREIKNLESERRTTMGMYTVVIYIAFLVFLGVVAVLYATFIPEFLAAAQGVTETGSGQLGSFGFTTIALADFRTFYFLAAVAQGVGNGLVAGIMESGRALSGLRHAFIMVAIAYACFGLLIG